MYALAGRPGCGKTAMMEEMIQSLLFQEVPVCVFEKDMSPEKLMARIACRGVGVPFWRYARGIMDRMSVSRIREALAVLRKQPLYVFNPTTLTADKMCSIARKCIRLNGVGAVFLDHIQALRVGEKQDLRAGLTQASLTIRANVTETNVPHILLAHINREGSKGRPSPENIKEFDQLYGDCDGMGILWSEKSRADLEEGELMEMNFYVAKNRDGEITDDPLLFDGANLSFKNKARE
jgi:replicative DNA helicase